MKSLVSGILVLVMLSSFICVNSASLPTDYIAAWDFESLTNSKIADLSKNGYDGVIRTITTMSRKENSGFLGSYGLEIPADTATNNTQMNAPGLGATIRTKNSVSISGWFKRNTVNSNERYLFNIPNDQGFVGLGASILADGKLKLQLRKLPSGLSSVTTTTTPTTMNEWFHYTFIVQLPTEVTGTATLAIYVNGEEAVKNTSIDVGGMTTFSTLNWASASDDFRLGGHGTGVFNGCLDDVKVFDRVLTTNEISLLAIPGIATELTSFKVGGYDALSLNSLEVASVNDKGAELYLSSFPVTGVQIGLVSGAKPRISVLSLNGVDVSDYESLSLKNGDTLIYTLQGDTWETDAKRYFKITLKSDGIAFSDVGFYNGQAKLESVSPGKFTAKAVVSSSYDKADDIIMLAIVRNKDTGLLKSVKMQKGIVRVSLGTVTLQTDITVENDGKNYTLELYLTDANFKAFTEVSIL